ncbi:MAG: imidazolonepropionase, partial [Dermatophilaceae bacterium]
MTATVITGIAELVTNDDLLEGADHSERLGLLSEAAVIVEAGLIAWVGPADHAPEADERRDVGGRAVIPGFVDSHSHLVFAGDRAAEFAARMTGLPYDGGGIANSVNATRAASDGELRTLVGARVAEMRAQGTTTVEIKGGYGLNVKDEARSLRIAAEFTSETTFLGAHVVPPEFAERRSEYVELVTGEMLAACAPHARWIDVFCEPHSPHAFTEDEARVVLSAGRDAGLA